MGRKEKSKTETERQFNYEESLAEEIIFQYVEAEGEKLLAENAALKEGRDYEMSLSKYEEAEQKGFRIVKMKKNQARLKIAGKIAAAACLILIIGFTIGMSTVDAFKVKVLNFLMSDEGGDIRVGLEKEYEYSVEKIKFNGAVVPSYVPEGYEVEFIEDDSFGVIIQFRNSEDELISYEQYDEAGGGIIDRERAIRVEEIEIDGNEGILIERDDSTTLIWSDLTFVYELYQMGGLESEYLIRMAHSLKRISDFKK